MQDRYHIQLSQRRTTITMDVVLSELLAVKLKVQPNTKEAHSLIREWLNHELIKALGKDTPTGSRLSQWARKLAIEAIADKKLIEGVIDYRIEN